MITSKVIGNNILGNDIPADLSATNSYCSPSFPKTITEAKSMAIGNAIGTNLADA